MINKALVANYRLSPRVRFNSERFGFIVAFPDGDIVLAKPSAIAVLHDNVSKAELEPHLLPNLQVWPGFYLSTPVLVWLELTRRCNLACPHCYIDGGKARSNEMVSDRWFQLIDELADMGVWAVAFTGGEPTLHPDFVSLVSHARQRDLIVGIATHGMFLSDKLLERLPTQGVIISVSIDELHVTQGNDFSSTSMAMEAIVRAQKHGFLTNIMTNTNRNNIHALGQLIEWAEQHSVSVRSVPMSPIGRGKNHPDLQNIGSDVEQAAKFWIRECEFEHAFHREAGLCVGLIFNYGLTLSFMSRRCASARYLCYIAADGTVFPCTMCAGEVVFPGGSVAKKKFKDVWLSEWAIRDLSWENFTQTCTGCPISDDEYFCSSRCPALSHARHGNFDSCGGSAFEIQSTLYRTKLLEKSLTGQSTNQPVVNENISL